jgi:hypothetical protein
MSLNDWFHLQEGESLAEDTVMLGPCSECWALVPMDDADLHQQWHQRLTDRLIDR